jgi:hypothetical protein
MFQGVDTDVAARGPANVGAWILGRNMVSPALAVRTHALRPQEGVTEVTAFAPGGGEPLGGG